MPDQYIYTVGGTVQASGGRYISRAVDEQLLQFCRDGEFSFVLTARQMGKSSLMVRTAEQLAKQNIQSVIVDLSQIGVQVSEDAWYLGILTRIEDSLYLETDVYEWWGEHQQLGHGQRLTAFFKDIVLREIDGPLVVFMDEIDSTLSLPFTDDFFAAIRYIYNARANTEAFKRLSFVLIGVATPSDLISDSSRTPFNIGKQVDIDYFTPEEAQPLAEGIGNDVSRREAILSWILKWTNGHPFLTQRVCATVSELDASTLTKADVDRVVRETFFGDQSEHDSNLRFVHDMLTRRADDPTAVLETYRQIIRGKKVQDDRQSRSITHLKLSGVVSRKGGRLQVRNAIYASVFDDQWLEQQWPEHWVKRVPPAVIGLVAASFAAVVLLAFLFFQFQRTNSAEDRLDLQTSLGDSLQTQFNLTASLNNQLTTQNVVLDSLSQEQVAANNELSRQVTIANVARRREVQANVLLSDQIVVAESLQVVAQQNFADAVDAKELSDSLAAVVQSQLDDASAARLETLTLALANAARRQERLGNADLGALLARQAFHFSQQGEGRYLDPILDALTSTLNTVSTSDAIRAGGPNSVGPLSAGVRSIEYVHDQASIVAGLEDGLLVVITMTDAGTSVSNTMSAHEGAVRSVIQLAQTGSIITAGDDGKILVWMRSDDGNYRSDELARVTGRVLALAASGDDTLFAIGTSEGEIHVWDVATRSTVFQAALPGGSPIRALALRQGDRLVAAGSDDGQVSILNSSGDLVNSWTANQGRILALAFNPANGVLASGGDDGRVLRWEFSGSGNATEAGAPLLGHEGPISSIEFDDTGRRLASGSYDHAIQVWDLSDAEANSLILQNHSSWVESLQFIDGGRRLISAGADRTVQVWNIDLEALASKVCSAVSTEDLSQADWDLFVGSDFSYASDYSPCQPTANAARDIP